MADITILGPDCGDDDDCDGERGKRGKRGHRGHRGHDGADGPTGPAGPAGPSEGALLGRQVFNVADSGTYTPTPGTRTAIVRGVGGGGGGGGVGDTAPDRAAGATGGNSGVAVEIEMSAPPNTLLTGGPITVGAGGLGTIGDGGDGGDSTLLINGVLLTAPGGRGGNGGNNGFIPPLILSPLTQPLAVGFDYQASDYGGEGSTISLATVYGGFGGSGDYGIGGRGGVGAGSNASGNGAGGGGGAIPADNPAVSGGDGAPGLWIIEEYS